MKKFKAILINIILLLVLGTITIAFFYGWKYYKQKYDSDKEEYLEQVTEENSLDKSALLIGEKMDDKDAINWGDIYFINTSGEQRFSIDTSHKISVMANPQATKNNLFYYEPGEKKNSWDHMILWAADFNGASENKIASFGKDYYPTGIWMSPDYSTVVYMRSYLFNEEYSYWAFHNNNGVAQELVPPSSNMHPVHYRGFNVIGDKFYYLEKYDDEEYRLNQVKIPGTIVSPSFRGIDWKNIDWDDLWEIKPIAISPTDNSMIFLDKESNKDVVKNTKIKKISDSGEFTTLTSIVGNVYELRWSGDKTNIAYNHILYNGEGKRQKVAVEIIKSDGSNPEVLYETNNSKNIIYDIYWGNNSKYLYFIDSIRGEYSEVVKVNIQTKESEIIYRRQADKDNDYIKILQMIDVPKELDWEPINEIIEKEKSGIDLQKIFEYVDDNINILAPKKASENSIWEAYKIGYITDSDIYVEYTDNHYIGRLLLHCNQEKNKIKCETVASFEPKDFQWELTDGNDYFDNKDVIYYENWNGQWEESYSSATKEVFPYNNNDIKALQKEVSAGKDQWRLDPVKVILNELPSKYGFNEKNDILNLFLSEDGESRVNVKHDGKEYEVKLFQLVKEGEGGIWTLVRIKNI